MSATLPWSLMLEDIRMNYSRLERATFEATLEIAPQPRLRADAASNRNIPHPTQPPWAWAPSTASSFHPVGQSSCYRAISRGCLQSRAAPSRYREKEKEIDTCLRRTHERQEGRRAKWELVLLPSFNGELSDFHPSSECRTVPLAIPSVASVFDSLLDSLVGARLSKTLAG